MEKQDFDGTLMNAKRVITSRKRWRERKTVLRPVVSLLNRAGWRPSAVGFAALLVVFGVGAVRADNAPPMAGPIYALIARHWIDLPKSCGAFISSDGAVEVDTTRQTGEWHEYLVTLPAKFRLAPFKMYRISYDYTVQKSEGEKTRYYHLLRSASQLDTKGKSFWTGPPATPGHKEFTVTIEDVADYQLVLGIEFGGAIRIENLEVQLLADIGIASGLFISGSRVSQIGGTLSKEAKYVDGGIEVNTLSETNTWYGFYSTQTSRISFQPGKTYQFDFDYAIKKVGSPETDFYCLLVDNENRNKTQGWQTWMDLAGTRGHRSFKIKINPDTDYKFVVGVRHKAVLHISNLRIQAQ